MVATAVAGPVATEEGERRPRSTDRPTLEVPEFEDEVKELGRLIGRDLSGWSDGKGTLVLTQAQRSKT
jgi:hypothetical protein